MAEKGGHKSQPCQKCPLSHSHRIGRTEEKIAWNSGKDKKQGKGSGPRKSHTSPKQGRRESVDHTEEGGRGRQAQHSQRSSGRAARDGTGGPSWDARSGSCYQGLGPGCGARGVMQRGEGRARNWDRGSVQEGSAKQGVEGQAPEHGYGAEHGCGTYTQGVLDIDEPTIETKKLSDLDQPISHRLVGALIPSQEGFTELATLLPLCDKGSCETRDRNGCRDGSPLTRGLPECVC